MATFFDVALLENFSVIFTFLLVFAIVYAILEFAKILGENKGIHAIIALSVAMIMLVSKSALEVINFTIPWFIILFIVAIFGIVGYKLFVGSDVDMGEMLKHSGALRTWIIVIVVVIFIGALAKVYGQNIGPYLGSQPDVTSGEISEDGEPSTATGSFTENLSATLFHPKVLGMIFILLIATFTITFLAGRQEI